MKCKILQKNVVAGAFFTAAISLVACGGDSSSGSGDVGNPELGENEVQTFEDLPACKSKNFDEVYSVVGEKTEYICSEDDQDWIEVVSKLPKSCEEKDPKVYFDDEYFVCEDGKFVEADEEGDEDLSSASEDEEDEDDDTSSSSKGKSSASEDEDEDDDASSSSKGKSSASEDEDDDTSSSSEEGKSSESVDDGSSSSVARSSSSSVASGTDLLGGEGDFMANGRILTENGNKLGSFIINRWNSSGVENGVIRTIRNDDDHVVMEFYPTRDNANVWDLQLKKDVTLKAGYSYQIYLRGYDYGTSRTVHVGIQSEFQGPSGTSYENYISDDGSWWDTKDYEWVSGKTISCQDRIAQLYINGGGDEGEGFAVESFKVIETKMPSSYCDDSPSTGTTDVLNGAGEFTKNGTMLTPNGDKIGVFNRYMWDASGNENGTIETIRNGTGDVVLQFWPTRNNANIYDLQLEKDIEITAGYSYQVYVRGYDYGSGRNIHVGIQSLRGANGTSYENYISDDGSFWNTATYEWRSGKAIACQTKTAQFYVNGGGAYEEGFAIESIRVIKSKLPDGTCN